MIVSSRNFFSGYSKNHAFNKKFQQFCIDEYFKFPKNKVRRDFTVFSAQPCPIFFTVQATDESMSKCCC